MIAVLLLGGVLLLGLAGSIYAGCFRAKQHVETWESRRETHAALILAGAGTTLVIAAVVLWATMAASWGGTW